jgi:hypothetical protein
MKLLKIDLLKSDSKYFLFQKLKIIKQISIYKNLKNIFKTDYFNELEEYVT